MKISLVKRKPPYCFHKQYGGSLLGLSVLTDGIILPQLLFQWKPPLGDEILFLLFQNFCQHFVALLKAGNGIHNLMVSCVASGFVQLHGQFRQLLGMGGIVAYHIFHQCNQFIHRGMGVIMFVTVLMQVIVAVRMLMGVGMFVVCS